MEDELQKVARGKTDSKTAQAVFAVVLSQVQGDLKEVKELLGNDYAKKTDITALNNRIKMLERIVYGAVGIILFAVFGALIALVVRSGGR
jgi:hypothetical protein